MYWHGQVWGLTIMYIFKKIMLKVLFMILYLGKGGKANKQIKNQGKEDGRAQVHPKGEIYHNYR